MLWPRRDPVLACCAGQWATGRDRRDPGISSLEAALGVKNLTNDPRSGLADVDVASRLDVRRPEGFPPRDSQIPAARVAQTFQRSYRRVDFFARDHDVDVMIGLAGSPGTEVEPTCSILADRTVPSARRSSSAMTANCAGHSSRYGTTSTAMAGMMTGRHVMRRPDLRDVRVIATRSRRPCGAPRERRVRRARDANQLASRP